MREGRNMTKQTGKVFLLTVASLILLIALPAMAVVDASRIDNVNNIGEIPPPPQDQLLRSPGAVYTGFIRVYITEVSSRWLNSWGTPYHYAFLEYALDEGMTLNDGQVIEFDTTVDISGWNVAVDNIAIVSSVFDSAQTLSFANPPSGSFFMANYSDAAALAYPGGYGMDTAYGTYTHTVFMEEATATW